MAVLAETRADLQQIEQDEIEMERRDHRREEIDGELRSLRHHVDSLVFKQAIAERTAGDKTLPKADRDAAAQRVAGIQEQGRTLLRQASRLQTEREEMA